MNEIRLENSQSSRNQNQNLSLMNPMKYIYLPESEGKKIFFFPTWTNVHFC